METKGNKEKCTLRFCDAESLSVAQEIIKHIHDDGSVEVRISGNDIVIIGSNSDISLTVNEINLKVTSAKMFIF